MTQEFQQTVNDLHLAECELALWRQFALEAIAGLTGTPAEGYDHPHTGPGQFKADARRLRELVAEKDGRIRHLERACAKQNADVCQTLGAALGYPWFRDDPATFPGATAGDGVCVGAHVAESIADEAAARIKDLEAENKRLRAFCERPTFGPDGTPLVPAGGAT